MERFPVVTVTVLEDSVKVPAEIVKVGVETVNAPQLNLPLDKVNPPEPTVRLRFNVIVLLLPLMQVTVVTEPAAGISLPVV